MQYMKLSTSRDFRINAATLEAALQEQDDSLDVSSSPYIQTDTSTRTVLDRYAVLFQATESQPAEETQEPKQKRRKHQDC